MSQDPPVPEGCERVNGQVVRIASPADEFALVWVNTLGGGKAIVTLFPLSDPRVAPHLRVLAKAKTESSANDGKTKVELSSPSISQSLVNGPEGMTPQFQRYSEAGGQVWKGCEEDWPCAH